MNQKKNKYLINEQIKLIDFLNNNKYNTKQIKKLILAKKIFVNHEIINQLNYELKPHDELVLKEEVNINNNQINDIYKQIKIIYEDEYFFIFFKPSGLLTVPNIYENTNTLFNYLAKQYSYLNQVERCGIVHRLDKNTAGLLIVAKTNEIYELFLHLFATKQIIKKYYAIVLNHLNDHKKYLINFPIGRKNNDDLKFTTINPKNPKEALTSFQLVKNLKNNTALVDIELITGRTHQIRVHMSAINHPILNDPLYSKTYKNDKYEQYLFAYYLKFNHPITYLLIEIKIPLDKQFTTKLKSLSYE